MRNDRKLRRKVRELLAQAAIKAWGDPANLPRQTKIQAFGEAREKAHGPRWSLRKRLWVRPHWRGVESLERVSKTKKLNPLGW